MGAALNMAGKLVLLLCRMSKLKTPTKVDMREMMIKQLKGKCSCNLHKNKSSEDILMGALTLQKVWLRAFKKLLPAAFSVSSTTHHLPSRNHKSDLL